MVARIELITVVRYQVYCDEEHKSQGVFNTQRAAIKAKGTHNATCDLIGDPVAAACTPPGDEQQ